MTVGTRPQSSRYLRPAGARPARPAPPPRAVAAPKLSVVILNHNSGRMLLDCVNSLFADDLPFEIEVIIPDNASTDDSVELTQARWGDRLKVIRNGDNRGFAWGNNIGIAACRGEYVCLLNPDTIVRRGCFRALLEFLGANPRAGFAGPKVLNPDGSLQLSCRRSIPSPFDAVARALLLSKLFPRSPRLARYNVCWLDPGVTQQVDASTGCCMVARRAMLEQIGVLDERFFIYCEDVDWFLRAKNAGWETWYVASAVLEHHHAYSAGFRRHRAVADFHRSMVYFYRKHYAGSHPAALNAAIYASVMARMCLIVCLKSVGEWRSASAAAR